MSTYISIAEKKHILSFRRNNQRLQETCPVQLTDGRYLKINKCDICDEYSFKGLKKVNNTNKPFFQYIPSKQCPYCIEFKDAE